MGEWSKETRSRKVRHNETITMRYLRMEEDQGKEQPPAITETNYRDPKTDA